MSSPAVPDDFECLIEDNYRRIFGVIHRLLGDPEEAADLTQDTFVNAYRARASFRGDCQAYTWLYRIAVNLTRNRLDELGRRARHSSPLVGGSESDWEEQTENATGGPACEAETAELGRMVAGAVLRLRSDYREVVILREYEDLSYEEIAQAVGCSVQAVKSRLFRARALLRHRLASYLGE
jgi:RNA polymerase sigma-70 factor, ECF subfamily